MSSRCRPTSRVGGGARPHAYQVVHLKRWRGLGYPEITDRVRDLLSQPGLAEATLVVDA